MDDFDRMNLACQRFKNREFGIEDFQSWLQTGAAATSGGKNFRIILERALNDLERILFLQPEEDHNKYGSEIADRLVVEVEEYKALSKSLGYYP
ncbi:MAG: hypothetical protein AAGU16_15400 [Desulfitobacterium hafniense]